MSLTSRVRATARLSLPGRVHLGELSALLARAYPGRLLIEDLGSGQRWTSEQLELDVARWAALYRSRGHTGVTLLSIANDACTMVHLLALVRAGAVPVPVSPRYTHEEVQHVIEAAGATSAVTDHAMGLSVPTTRLQACDPAGHLGPRRDEPGELALYMTTSGTTGRPKAASLTSAGLLSALAPLAAAPVGLRHGPRRDRDRVLSALPLTHVMGLAVALGALMSGVRWQHLPHFDALRVLDAIEQHRPNVFVGVPTMFADLEGCGLEGRQLSSVQLWISGADRMPEDRAMRFQEHGASIAPGGRGIGRAAFLDLYGMVELSGPVAMRAFLPSVVGPSLRTPHHLLPSWKARAVDEQGKPRWWGQPGELAFHGPGVLRGYRGVEGAGPDAHGWFRSGDSGRVWPGGWFTFGGRSRDRLKVGGFSVFPAEVEASLVSYPGLRDIALVGLPDARLGERPVAAVLVDASFDRSAFLSWARGQVAGYRRPADVFIVDALPRGKNGKLDRKAITEMVCALADATPTRAPDATAHADAGAASRPGS